MAGGGPSFCRYAKTIALCFKTIDAYSFYWLGVPYTLLTQIVSVGAPPWIHAYSLISVQAEQQHPETRRRLKTNKIIFSDQYFFCFPYLRHFGLKGLGPGLLNATNWGSLVSHSHVFKPSLHCVQSQWVTWFGTALNLI